MLIGKIQKSDSNKYISLSILSHNFSPPKFDLFKILSYLYFDSVKLTVFIKRQQPILNLSIFVFQLGHYKNLQLANQWEAEVSLNFAKR